MARRHAPDRIPVYGAWRSHQGNFRRNNEDMVHVGNAGRLPEIATGAPSAGEATLDTAGNGSLCMVCDGVGGGQAGEIASALAVTTFGSHLSDRLVRSEGMEEGLLSESRARAYLGESVEAAHRSVVQRMLASPELEGMGTTLAGVWLLHDHAHVFNVGDSRVYRLRRGEFRQLTQDQSYVSRLVRQGALSSDEARTHPLRNIIDQVVGGSDSACRPEIESFDLKVGDEYLVCTDGLPDSLEPAVIWQVWVDRARSSCGACLEYLEKLVLDRAGRDNVTMALLRVGRRSSNRWQAMVQRYRSRHSRR